MRYIAKIAGVAVLAAGWMGIAGCDHDEHRGHGVVVVPDNGGYYDGGYHHAYRHYGYDRDTRGYHMDRDYDHHDYDHQDHFEHRSGVEHHSSHR